MTSVRVRVHERAAGSGQRTGGLAGKVVVWRRLASSSNRPGWL